MPLPSTNPADNPPDYGDTDTDAHKEAEVKFATNDYAAPDFTDDIPYKHRKEREKEAEFDWSLVRTTAKDEPVTDSWFVKNWRPAMAWLYMAMCGFDFIVAPVLYPILPVLIKGAATTPWHPLTLEGSGLIHMTFMAVLGITAWGRTKEKIDPHADDRAG